MDRRQLIQGAAATGLILSTPACASLAAGSRPGQTVWTFDQLTALGGAPLTVEGGPTLTAGPTQAAQATLFDGVDDALFVGRHPLAGASTFTFEAIFRPDGGEFAQRWFHLAENETPVDNQPLIGTRFLFEIRVVKNQWALDAFIKGPGYNQTLLFLDKLHPVGPWYHVAQTYDGTMYRAFVNGVLQGEAAVAFKAQGAGRASVGCRMNRVNYFKGAVAEARFTPEALAPADFTGVPA
ncbi:LamG domain-containing protein [soil metagenome]